MTGFFSRVSMTSRQITSEAIADPPGLSMRITTARTESSARALRKYSTIVSEPITWLPGGSPWRGSASRTQLRQRRRRLSR